MNNSSITKKAMAAEFKKLLHSKPVDKITISDITGGCGLNRQTFYYHFQDKYELINWIYYNEAIMVFRSDLTRDNWDRKVLELLTVMKNDAFFYETTLTHISQTEFENDLFTSVKELFIELIDHLAKDQIMDTDKKIFLSEFIAYGATGMILAWSRKGLKQSPEEITRNIKEVIDNSRINLVSRVFQNYRIT